MLTASASTWTVEPFRMATPEEYSRVRDLFVRVGFEEDPLFARFGITSIRELLLSNDQGVFRDNIEITDALSLLVKLFLRGERVPWSVVRSVLNAADLAAIEALGVLHSPSASSELCTSTIAIYPLSELFIASDRLARYDATTEKPPTDVVYSPITPQTISFLRLMPRDRCDSLLDLCTGTGVLALVAASDFARRATATDVSERAVRFATFNAALNNLTNVQALQGSVYEPIGKAEFDMIVAHPPYVPAFETKYVWRDGGEDGEQITRAIIAGLLEHLRPGGQFFCSCMLTDRKDAPLENRLRAMLGAASDEFDIVVAQEKTVQPLQFCAEQARSGHAPFDGLARWNETIKRLGIEQMVVVALLLQRRNSDREVITTRRALSPLTSAADLQWLVRWLLTTNGWGIEEYRRLLASRPRVLPRTELQSRSRVHEGQWSVEECTLVTLAPFAVQATCPNWYATLLQFCDGRMTAREHLQYLRDTHAVPDAASEDAFAMMIRQLVDAGLVEIDEFRLPDATSMRETAGTMERTTGSGPVERAD